MIAPILNTSPEKSLNTLDHPFPFHHISNSEPNSTSKSVIILMFVCAIEVKKNMCDKLNSTLTD